MKLSGIHISPADYRRKKGPVLCGSGYQGRIRAIQIIGVNEVEVGSLGDAFQQGDISFEVDGIPSHVGDFETLGKSFHPTGEDSEPLMVSELFALGTEELKS